MAKTGLDKWFNEEKWVDISAPKKNGSWVPCGRKSATKSKRGKPKCVPLATANNMTVKEIRSAVDRKRKAEKNKKRDGNKPINVKTFV
tara:strand:- start:44 stop:307 length:264 start_codon:yes stop_codon:yes gene_type:complete